MSAAMDVSTLSVVVKSDGIKETANGLNSIYREAKKAEDRVITLTSKIEKLSTVFMQGSASAQAYQQSVANANRATGAHSSATGALNSVLQTLTGSINRLNSNLGTLHTRTTQNTQAIRFHTDALVDAHAAARGLSGALGALWVTYGNMIPLAAGLAIGAGFKAIVSQGKDVEQTLESIRVKGDESVESVGKMRAAILSIGQGIYGPKEVASAFETLILAGASAKDALTGIKDALNLATVGGTSIEKSAYAIVQVATSLGYTANGYTQVADVIAKTAATSMSSVESISEAFKSGSAVAKLYGASLVDIGTSFAALSNLGIQGSAAGTSLKNFYKELSSEGKKVTDTFKAIGISSSQLKDAQGNFLPLAQLLPILSDGLNQLSEAEQKTALNRISNERGLKTLVELLSLYRNEASKTGKTFTEMNKEIEESWGYTAIGAAAMSLTVNNQLKSVGNTLQTTFVQAFQNIQPQLSVISVKLKQTFTSPEFISGVQRVSLALAELASWVVQNIPFITNLIEIFLTFKAVAFVAGMLVSIAEGFIAFKKAADLAKISALAFQASLGGMGLLLAGVAAAMVYFISKKEELGKSEQAQASLTYINNFTESLNEEAKRLKGQIDLMNQGKTAADAYTESLRNRNLEMVKEQGNKMVKDAQDKVDDLKSHLSPFEKRSYNRAKSIGATSIQMAPEVNAVLAAERDVTKAVEDSTKAYKEAEAAVARVVALSKEKAALEDKQAKDRASNPNAGTGVLVGNDESHKMSMAEKDLKKLLALRDGYIEKSKAVQAYGEEEIKVMAMVESARVKDAIAEGMYNDKHSAHFLERLQQVALEADQAKFKLDKEQALGKLEGKVVGRMAAENAAMQEANSGHTKFVGTLEAEANELLRIWQIDRNSDRAKKLLDEAKATDELAAKKDKMLKFNKETDSITTKASSLMEEGDALMQYGAAGKQTAVQLAELKIQQNGLSIMFAEGAIKARLVAAGMEDIGIAYRGLAKTAADLEIKNSEIEAEIVANILQSEEEKVLAKYETSRKAIEFLMQQAEVGKQVALANGEDAAKVEERYTKATEAAKKAMAQLDKQKNFGLDAAKLKDFDKLMQRIDEGANKLTGSFSKVGKSISGMVTAFMQFGRAQEKYNQDLKIAKDLQDSNDPEERAKGLKDEQKAGEDRAKSEIESYANMAGAAKGFFAEGSKGYKTLQAAETAWRAYKLASDLVEGVSAAAVAVANQAKGDPYTAWARMAAMAAAMAALGFAVSGGGSGKSVSQQRQEDQGTGTILGDASAKSQSISKSIDLLANNSNISLKYSSAMLSSLRSIQASLSGLGNLLIRNAGLNGNTPATMQGGASKFASSTMGVAETGALVGAALGASLLVTGPIALLAVALDKVLGGFISKTLGKVANAIFGGKVSAEDTGITMGKTTLGEALRNGVTSSQYTDMKKDGGWFSSDKHWTDLTGLGAEADSQFQKIIKGMADGLTAAAGVFGKSGADFTATLENFSIDIGKISLKGMDGAKIQETLENIFSTLGDNMAKSVLGGLEDFQKVGEGYLETVIRVASGVDSAKAALDQLGVAMIDYTQVIDKQGDVATEVIRQSLEATEGLSGVGDILRTFVGTADDLTSAYKELMAIRQAMNNAGVDGQMLSVDVIRGAGGLDSLRSGIDSYFENFFTDTEKLARKTENLRSQFQSLGVTMPENAQGFRSLISSIDLSTGAGQRLFGQLIALSGAFNDLTQLSSTVSNQVTQNAKDAEDKANAERERLISVVETAYGRLEKSVEAEKKRLTDLYDAQVKAIKDQATIDKQAAQDRLKVAEDNEKAIKTVFDAINNAIKSTQVDSLALTAARRQEALQVINNALATSNTGGTLVNVKGLDDALQTIAKPSENLYATFEDYARDQASTALTLNSLAFNAERQLSDAELTISAINDTIAAIDATSEAQIEALDQAHQADMDRLDGILDTARAQLDALRGIDNSVLTLSAAMASFASAYSSAAAGLPRSSSSSSNVGTQSGVVAQMYSSILGRTGDTAGSQFWQMALNTNERYSTGQSSIISDFIQGAINTGGTDAERALAYAKANNIPGFAVGTNEVPVDMLAQIHAGERIVPAADNAELMRRLREPETSREERQELIQAINELKQVIITGDVANKLETKELSQVIKKWDGEGMPETRTLT